MHRNQGHTRRFTRCTNAGAAAVDDLFGPDGFGDTWDESPKALFDSDSDEDFLWPAYVGSDSDWGKSPGAIHREEQAKAEQSEQAKRKEQEVLHKCLFLKKKKVAKEAAGKAAAIAEAKEAAVEAKEAAVAADATKRWVAKVKEAEHALSLAKPVQALDILYSLFADDAFTNTVYMEEQEKTLQMTCALEIHYKLQKTLSIV